MISVKRLLILSRHTDLTKYESKTVQARLSTAPMCVHVIYEANNLLQIDVIHDIKAIDWDNTVVLCIFVNPFRVGLVFTLYA